MIRFGILIILSTLFTFISNAELSSSSNRDAVIGFGLMITKVTGRNPLDYCGYGNFCGRSGSGAPVDAIDRCCKAHDECYNKLSSKYSFCLPHLALYTFSYDKAANKVSCNAFGGCSTDTCDCDRIAALCFKSNESKYNPGNKGSFFGQLKDCLA